MFSDSLLLLCDRIYKMQNICFSIFCLSGQARVDMYHMLQPKGRVVVQGIGFERTTAVAC